MANQKRIDKVISFGSDLKQAHSSTKNHRFNKPRQDPTVGPIVGFPSYVTTFNLHEIVQ